MTATLVSPTIQECTAILGKNNVVSAEQVDQLWDCEIPNDSDDIHFSREILGECARKNRDREADWRLVYVFGFSMLEQRKIRKERPAMHLPNFGLPCFQDQPRDSNYIPEWEAKEVATGYRLLNFQPEIPTGMDWDKQEAAIARLGDNFERAEEQAVTEAVFSIYMATGEALLGETYHWGRCGTYTSERACVGMFGKGQMKVDARKRKASDPTLRVVVARKS